MAFVSAILVGLLKMVIGWIIPSKAEQWEKKAKEETVKRIEAESRTDLVEIESEVKDSREKIKEKRKGMTEKERLDDLKSSSR